MHNPLRPPPAPPAFAQGKALPENTSSLFSRLVFEWLSPFLSVGFSRPLETDDLWKLPSEQLTSNLTDAVESNFYTRWPDEDIPLYIRQKLNLGLRQSSSDATVEEDEEKGKEKTSIEKPNSRPKSKKAKRPSNSRALIDALHQTFFNPWWISGILKLLADTLKTTTPLLSKVILTWLTDSYTYHRLSAEERALTDKPQGIGYGVGLAIALFAMQEIASLMTNHFQMLSMSVGISVRTSMVGNIFRKSLRLSGRARLEHSVGKITTMISTDTARLDTFCRLGHNVWVAPIQIAIGIGLLIGNLGYSALVGLAVLLFSFPLQMLLVRVFFTQRLKGVKITDTRLRFTTEVLQGIRLIKFYAWENFYANQISELRKREIRTIRNAAIARGALIAFAVFVPVLASVLSFITYALTGHDLNVAIIFSSLQFFNIIRAPVIYFPVVLNGLSDCVVAIGRISTFFAAEELENAYIVDNESQNAVEVDGDFQWEVAKKQEAKFKTHGHGHRDKDKDKGSKRSNGNGAILPTTVTPSPAAEPDTETPFELKNLQMTVPKGAFVAIVGRVGSGKSSILQALIGEMRRIRGEVVFGGTVAYVPQTAWIRTGTLRENIIFGQELDKERFREVIHACSLERDLEMLPHGEETEIGEKGINLSGGQKARVSLARAAYSPSDVILLDDPLSAVDSYVGKSILENCLLSGPLASRTRILVTHALHVLDKTDYIYVVDNGVVIEKGTFDDLMEDSKVFSRLMEEYGSQDQEDDQDAPQDEGKQDTAKQGKADEKNADLPLMQQEERSTGAVSFDTYAKYLKFAGGLIWAPVFLFLLIASQGSQVGNNLFLGFWTALTIPSFSQGDYMGVYAALGVAQAIFQFLLSWGFAVASLEASLNLFKAALNGVLHSPTALFDTTPIGRILSRLSKDQDTLDSQLANNLTQFLTNFSSVIGTIGLVFYTFPLLGIIFAPMIVLYYLILMFYRRSSVETKRLDSLLRSILYASYSETLTGLSTIRAFNEQDRSIRNADHGLDMENRAYYMTIAIQRWLAVRLDVLGNVLVFGIALFAAGFRTSVSPSKTGVVLSYTLSITQLFSDMVSQFAQNEQNMNAVERILVYTELPAEGLTITPNDPPSSWPEKGEVKFINVDLAYRENLPLVLKDVSFDVRPGEKVGIVGRTGAGKSSLLQALFRTVELRGGKVEIDGYNIHDIGLDALRKSLALVPQDSTLFLGTLRENIDPQGTRTDAELISALQRAWLLPRDGTSDPIAEAKFSLDCTVSDDGSNYSAGEKQLLSLCRALVKNSRIIILDEATSSVDAETDAKLQRTIRTEFAESTLLCIAHRLNTIVYYDRVLVMDAGQVAEFDTVLDLFDKEGSIFRSLCDDAGLSRQDILRIREDAAFVGGEA